ncbi:MAG: cytochrome c biogenesis protein CcdA [Thermincola sp.]|nr:cytochrome c biogenesis protein CcdA [Thermincola sp.]
MKNIENISVLFAFTAGVLSFFSPCIFPLLPAYVANLTGTTINENKIDVSKKVLMLRSISFILGFSMIFMLLGASATLFGRLFAENRSLLVKIGGLVIILFGFQMTGILNLRFLMREKRWQVKPGDNKNTLNSFLLGLAFGTGWTPCVGLSLSSILLLAGSSDTLYSGLGLLVIYSLGLGIPFILLSLLITHSFSIMNKINKFLPYLAQINGWILIGMGTLLFTGQLQKISAWLAGFAPLF